MNLLGINNLRGYTPIKMQILSLQIILTLMISTTYKDNTRKNSNSVFADNYKFLAFSFWLIH
jgi:hypothetical protein